MQVNLSAIPGAFHLPRPNWGVIRAWLEENISEPDRQRAWTEVSIQWLHALNKALGNGYATLQDETFLLFAPRNHEQGKPLLQFAEFSLSSILDTLGDVACADWAGPLVILLFADAETYYAYVSQFYSEGEFGGSGGMCIRNDHLHVALEPGLSMASK